MSLKNRSIKILTNLSSKINAIKLPAINGINRLGLWILLILLSILILIFPTSLNFEYSKIQSIHIFKNLPLFSILFYSLVSILFLLIISKRYKEGLDWEQLALVLLFNLIFLGFWVINTPQGTIEGWAAIAHIKYLQREGTITLNKPNFGYFNFPGIHILILFISQVSGLTILATRTLFLLIITLLFSTILYIYFSKILKNTFLSSFAAIIFTEGNWMFSRLFHLHPALLGLIFFITFLVLSNRDDQILFKTWQDKLISIILLITTTITHFVTSFLFLFVLLGIYVVQKTGKDKIVNLSTIIIFALIPVTWNFTYAFRHLNILILFIPRFFKITSFMELFSYILVSAEANVSSTIPIWANVTRLFWGLTIYGGGTILAIKNLVNVKNLTSMEKKGIGSVIGVIILVIILTLLSLGGYQYYRYLIYSPLFVIPIIINFLFITNNQMRKHSFTLLITLLLVFSFPTFLANNSLISTKTVYQHELSFGEFLRYSASYDEGEDLIVFTTGQQTGIISYWVPSVSLRLERNYYTGIINNVQLQRAIDELLSSFLESSKEDQGNSIFIFSTRLMIHHQHLLGIYTTNPIWMQLEDSLYDANKIYTNNHIQVYTQ